MGRELQKKKNRSSINKVKLKPKSKKVNPLGNPLVAANWYENLQTTYSNKLTLFKESKWNPYSKLPSTRSYFKAKQRNGRSRKAIHEKLNRFYISDR